MLSDAQKSEARWRGAEMLVKRRSHLRRLKTSLHELRRDACSTDADREDLYKGMRALDRMQTALEADINEAKAIKRDWDKRVADATQALQALPIAGVADVIALAELDHSLGRPAALIEAVEHFGWAHVDGYRRREAIAGLARRCASDASPPAKFVAAVRDAMPQAAARHADLIQRINTLAVAQQIERAAHQPGGL